MGNSVTSDGAGNVYATGIFRFGSVNFGTTVLFSSNGADYFLAKYTSAGALVWVRLPATNAPAPVNSIGADTAGNLFVGGILSGTTTFDGTNLTSFGGDDIYLAKYDPNGQVLWVRQSGGTNNDAVNNVTVGNGGKVYVTGSFSGTAAFGGTNLTSAGGTDAFVAKYDSNGVLLWVHQAGGNTNEAGTGVAVDGSDNVYVMGTFGDVATFGSTNLNSSNGPVFIAKYNSSGDLVRIQQVAGGSALAADAAGNIYLTGGLSGTWNFGGDPVSSSGALDAFVAKFDTNGSFVGIEQASVTNPYGAGGNGIGVDGTGKVYAAGFSSGTATIGSTTVVHDCPPGSEKSVIVFIAKLQVSPYGTPVVFVDGKIGADFAITNASSVQVTLRSALTNNSLLYTLDGSSPSFASTLYTGPFILSNSATIRAIAYSADLSRSQTADPVQVLFIPSYSLTVSTSGNGTVSLNPLGGSYLSNTVVTATATPAVSWVFDHWNGDASGSSTNINIVMDGPSSIQAVFHQVQTYSLTASTLGGGSIQVDPATGPYQANSSITVAGIPTAGWTLLQWLGDVTGANATNIVFMSRNKSVQAVFGTTLGTTTNGNGTVVSAPPGGIYPYGTLVRLTAVPQTGYYFALWGNAASDTNNPLQFTVTNANATVSSLFAVLGSNQFSLTVLANGSGQVEANPYRNFYTNGQSVTLTATANSGQSFTGWSGDATGTQNSLNVTMDQSKTITASFTSKPRLTGPAAPGISTEGARLILNGGYSARYAIEGSTNLLDWISVGTVTNAFGAAQLTDPSVTNLSRRFYRALFLP